LLKVANLSKKIVYWLLGKVINKSNEWTFLKFVQLVNFLPFTKYNFFRRLRNSLLHLPDGRSYTQKVVGYPVNFLYRTELYDDFRIECRSSFSEYELISRGFFFRSSKSAQVILDIGAYSGIYSITASLANRNAHVYAFEPNPEIFSLAQNNIKLNHLSKNVTLMPLALGNELGREKLFFNVSGWETATASLSSCGNKFVEVEVSTIDLNFGNIQVDLIKIDVEGFEAKVLSGGRKMLIKCHPIILSEVLTDRDMASQSEVLRGLGYELPIQVSLNPNSSDFRNYIWFTSDKRQAVLRNIREARSILLK
jgi:FkbM family methyltransferase